MESLPMFLSAAEDLASNGFPTAKWNFRCGWLLTTGTDHGDWPRYEMGEGITSSGLLNRSSVVLYYSTLPLCPHLPVSSK